MTRIDYEEMQKKMGEFEELEAVQAQLESLQTDCLQSVKYNNKEIDTITTSINNFETYLSKLGVPRGNTPLCQTIRKNIVNAILQVVNTEIESVNDKMNKL